MDEMRWLLQVSISAEPKPDLQTFQLRLRSLDEPGESAAVFVQTVDDLVAVLAAAWQKRRARAAPPPA